MSLIIYSVQAYLIYFTFTLSQDVPCRIDFGCEECLPDYVPMIASHHLNGSVLEIVSGDKVTFFCHKTNFQAYPDNNLIRAFCENDKYRIIHDTSIRHLTDLGCQTNFLEDILHHVDDCSLPSQGRSYQYEDKGVLAVRHLAELCYDQDQARTIFVRTTTAAGNSLPQRQHSDTSGPLSFIGNLNHMLDTTTKIEADKIYSDAKKINKRMYELLKHYDFNFAGNLLLTSKLLSPYYFKDQNMMATNFASNKIAMWQSVAEANMLNVNKDVSRVIDAAVFSGKQLDIYVGTHGVLTLTSHNTPVEIYLKSHKRFPVPKYVWTIIADKNNHKGLAIIVLNNPFLTVSEIRNSVFCNSECSKITWLNHLVQNNNYETPMYGLVFCCNVHSFAETVKETPKDILDKIHVGNEGLLTFIPTAQ